MREHYDFSNSVKASEVPHLKKHQEETKRKTRITIMIDNDVLERFRAKAKETGQGYQTLINQTLRSTVGEAPLDESTLRKVIREELSHVSSSEGAIQGA